MRLSRRQRRTLAALAHQIDIENPELAKELHRTAPRPSVNVPKLIAKTQLALGTFLMTSGWVLASSGTVAVGAILLATCWIPWSYDRR
jgi:hypothetical protein